jgi:phenylalanyl-tRNA synthetase beta chain
MKVALNWLKQYVDVPWTPAELTERLTMLGLEVEGVETLGGGFENVVVGQVLTREKHPNADKLSYCRVHDGQGERMIVCGAQNFQPGDKVPLALPGAVMPTDPGAKPFVIAVGKIRGLESQGMMCSATELRIDPAALGLKKEDGLLILPPTATVGQPFAAFLGRGEPDTVFDLEVTPNRPDLNSYLGIAREIAALTGAPLKVPDSALPSGAASVTDLVAVRLEAPDLCPRYSARVIRGVKVGPSPAWLRSALEKVGLRSINNLVDITNYVMLETGQPLHAFDYRLIAPGAAGKPVIVVRRAADGEKFVTLDGRDHLLNGESLLIADERRGIALAGIMGGQNTEIRNETTDVLIESAYFTPTGIRRTAKTLGLRTDASYRFERGGDPGRSVELASERCASLMLELAGGTLAGGVVDERAATLPARKSIPLRHRKVGELLGVDIPAAQQTAWLQRLELGVLGTESTGLETVTRFEVPTFRVDLKREADLIEEIARLHGVDKIPSLTPRGALGAHPFDSVYDQFARLRRLLAGLGLSEAQGQTLVSRARVRDVAAETVVGLSHPLSSDMDVLRPSLLPGLLDTLKHNLAHRNGDVQLFEIGRVFRRENGVLIERWRLAIALTGARNPGFWAGADRDAKCDVFDVKGLVEAVMEDRGLRGVQFTKRDASTELFLESAAIALGGRVSLGEIGQLLPRLARDYDLRDPVFLAELDLEPLLAGGRAERSAQPLPAFPSMRRDIAMVVPETVTHAAVVDVVRKTKPVNLETTELFDVFRGKHVPEGHKSLAYAFTYRAADRTLKDEEVTAAHGKLVEALEKTLGAKLRE